VPIGLFVAAGVGRVLFVIAGKHRNRAINNIRMAFPEWGDEQVVVAARRSFMHFAQLMLEVLYVPSRIHRGNYEKHVTRKNHEPGLTMMYERKPIVVVTGHVGNFEAIGYLLALEGHPLNGVMRPMDNPLINDWMVGKRTKRGHIKIIQRWDNANTQILDALRNNEAVGLIADQNGGDRGVFVPYFGKLASAKKTVGLLAMHMNVPVVCGSARRTRRYGLIYEVEVTDIIYPADWAAHPDPLYYITARYVRAIETMVRVQPHQYMWMHRRWKSRPRLEREGKAMPAAFEEKLRSLPWVDDELMASLKAPLGFDS